ASVPSPRRAFGKPRSRGHKRPGLLCPLGRLPLGDDLPEVRCQFVVVAGKALIQSALRPFFRLLSPLFALGGLALVFLYFGLKISLHGTHSTQPRTTFDSTVACVPVRKDGRLGETLQRRSGGKVPALGIGSRLDRAHPRPSPRHRVDKTLPGVGKALPARFQHMAQQKQSGEPETILQILIRPAISARFA